MATPAWFVNHAGGDYMNEAQKRRREEIYRTKYKPAYDALMKVYPFTLEDLDGEEWTGVSYNADFYHISNYGRLKSFQKGRVKIIKPCLHTCGYLYFDLFKNGKYKKAKAHRLVAEAFIPNPNNLPTVDHVSNNKFDNSVGNLRWATHAENNQYAYDTGAKKSGEGSYQATLTNEQAAWCREVYIPRDKEFGASALAKKLGVNLDVVYDAARGRTYRDAGGGSR